MSESSDLFDTLAAKRAEQLSNAEVEFILHHARFFRLIAARAAKVIPDLVAGRVDDPDVRDGLAKLAMTCREHNHGGMETVPED